jgi:hypothetical protein
MKYRDTFNNISFLNDATFCHLFIYTEKRSNKSKKKEIWILEHHVQAFPQITRFLRPFIAFNGQILRNYSHGISRT